MTTKANTFEGGTDTTAISAANSGGTSGDAVANTTGTAPTYSTSAAMHGFLGMSGSAASGTASTCNWTGFSSTTMAYRFYYKHRAPSAATQMFQSRTAAGQTCGITANTSGTLQVVNSSGATTNLTALVTPALTAGTWYRIELQVLSDASAGTVSFQVYTGDSFNSVVNQSSSANVNTRGGNITEFRLGKHSTSTDTGTFLFDTIKGVDGTTTAIGPYLNALVIPRHNPQLTLR